MATALLSGSEYVLVAEVPKAGGRWHQAHFNVRIAKEFFRAEVGEQHQLDIEWMTPDGTIAKRQLRPFVFSPRNGNYKVEFDFRASAYPPLSAGRPLLVILELGMRRFRYMEIMPGEPGYEALLGLVASLPTVGRGVRRVITNLDEVELAWPACPIRGS